MACRDATAPPQPIAVPRDAARAIDATSHRADVTLSLTPECDPGSEIPATLAVALTAPLSGKPVFRIDDRVQGASGMAALISDPIASDRSGPVPLTRRMSGGTLELAATREVVGPVTLRYRAHSVATDVDGARWGLRHDATGIGGSGDFFLVLPELHGKHTVAFSVPHTCPSSWSAFTSLGDSIDDLSDLRTAAYFVGAPKVVTIDAMRAVWFGGPAFDVDAVTAWAVKMFAAERAFFRDTEPVFYTVFGRQLPGLGERSNGNGGVTSLFLTFGPKIGFGPRLRINIAHELLHRWLGMRLRLAGPEGTNYWFSEGFTTYYANVLAFRAGLISLDEFVVELDHAATKQFANKFSNASNDQIARDFFTSNDLSLVPYTRGALYAAELDAAIRKASNGQRSLDDAIRELYAARTPAPTLATFRDRIRSELGQRGVDRFDAVIVRGGTPDPPKDAYGPAIRRVPAAKGFIWEAKPER